MPKIGIRDRTAPPQWEGTYVLKDKELVKLTDNDNDFFRDEVKPEEKKIEQVSKREEAQPEHMKSVRLPKGPQKPISSSVQVEAMAVFCLIKLAIKSRRNTKTTVKKCSPTQSRERRKCLHVEVRITRNTI